MTDLTWVIVALLGVSLACVLVKPARWKVWLGVTLTIVALLSAVLWVMAPIAELPAPQARFRVGTTEMELVDSSRPEMHTANPLDHRALMVRIWYPANVDRKVGLDAKTTVDRKTGVDSPDRRPKRAPYWLHAREISRAINERHWPYGWFLRHLDEVPTHSYLDAPMAGTSEVHPVLVFSHGLGLGYATQNTPLMEELASRGYVVFAIDHPYDGLATVFPDGRVAQYLEDAYEPDDPAWSADFKQVLDSQMNSADVQALSALVERSLREQPRGTQLSRYWIDVWSRDQRFVIDEIERLHAAQRPNPFAGRLDVSRIGVFGMSFGGIAATATCAADPRCKAGINMDGFVPASADNPPQRVPFMYFANARVNINLIFMERDASHRYYVKVPGTEHLDFTDLPALARLLKLTGISGAIDARRMLELMNDFVGAFFDHHLLAEPAALLEQAARKYPEVEFKARSPVESSL